MTNKEMPRRLRVLMSAYACEPGKGSEPGVGWNLAKAMATRHDVWVVTRANNRPVIESELEEQPVPNLHFLYYDLPRWASWWLATTTPSCSTSKGCARVSCCTRTCTLRPARRGGTLYGMCQSVVAGLSVRFRGAAG